MALTAEQKKRLLGGGTKTATGGDVQEEFAGTDIGIKYLGREICLPADPSQMNIPTAISFLEKAYTESQQTVDIIEEVDAYIWDGAHAFTLAMKEMFGHAHAKTTVMQTMFGEMKRQPKFISIEVGVGQHAEIVWGEFQLPGFEEDEVLASGVTEKDGRRIFCIRGQVRRVRKPLVQQLAKLTRKLVREQSIYRGKVIELPLKSTGREVNTDLAPKFLDLSNVHPEELVFSESLQRIINANLFMMITDAEAVSTLGVPPKRTVVLAGVHGTGKTMAAMIAAKLCEQHDRTCFYIRDVRALGPTIDHARVYGRSMIFAEDFDVVFSDGNYHDKRALQNILDGIDKNMDIIIVLTTNHPDRIEQAFRRSGRVDITIGVHPPDADAALRLVQLYSRGFLAPGDYTAVSQRLAGRAPSNIREVVEGAKLYARARIKSDGGDLDRVRVTAADLLTKLDEKDAEAALYAKEEVKEPELTSAFTALLDERIEGYFTNGGGDKLADLVASAVRED